MPIRKSSISGTPSGHTANRPSSPSIGQTYYNGDLGYQEIYTGSGWVPTGSGSFTVLTSSGGIKTATLSNAFPAGTYTIESKAGDTDLVVYLASSSGTLVGVCTSGAKTITASDAFIYVSTENANSDDAVTFTLKTASTLHTKTDAVWSKPTITAISVSGLPNINNTTNISGTNFASNVIAQFRKSDNSTLLNAKNVARTSATSLTITRPDELPSADAPYDLIITNPDTGYSITSTDAITAGSSPVWVTADGLGTFNVSTAISTSVQATDADSGSTVSYSVVSGSLAGISLNSGTGALTGTTPSSEQTLSFTVRATDSGGNFADRAFSMVISSFYTTGGNISNIGNERVHVFNSNGTLTIPQTISNVKILLVAGGGSNGNGGGGGGGLLYHAGKTLAAGSYAVTIGAGGSYLTNGINSVFSDMTAIGGGHGCAGTGGCHGNAGGSGGGAGRDTGNGGAAQQGNSGGATGYGHAGGNSAQSGWGGAGGGGGAGSAGNGGSGGGPHVEYGGAGGNGRQYDITGTSKYYAGGCNGSWGGGGGGQAGLGAVTNAAGPANSGSGGSPGGSGICVIRLTVPN